ncbi:MAG: PAS domain S-box protein [Desulfobacteraceae bacterium]|nr:MAG: PAS domain S-box protein [Desulfobacteraceae bacterium]
MTTAFSDKRRSGIALLGDLPWGAHLCQFYQTKEDLIDILVPYFKAGLENNEYCLWVTFKPLGAEHAKKALERAVPRFEEYVKRGQIDLIPQKQWRTAGLTRSGEAVVSRLDRAIAGGFEGLRCAIKASSKKRGGGACYGADLLSSYNVISVCAYQRDEFDAIGIMEVVKEHRLALVRNLGRWEVIESSEAWTVKHALKRSEEKLHSLFNNMSEGFAYHRIVLDIAMKPCDYIFLEVNDAFERLTGLEGKQIIGKRATEVLAGIEKDSTDWIGMYGKVALTGEPVHFESYSEALQRWYAISAFSPHKGFFAVTFSDITEKKKSEEELLKAKTEWELTFDSVPDLIAILDRSHRVVRVNRAMAERLGRKPEQCAGFKCHEVMHGLPGPILGCPHAKSIADGKEHIEEIREPLLGGIFLVSTTPMYDEAGKLLGCVHTARDITARKEAEEALTKAHEKLKEHAAKLEAANRELEGFSYSVSHDLRAPLRAIAGFTRMILDEQGVAFDSETRRKFDIVQENALKMGRLIDDLLRLSRLGRTELNRSKLDMAALAREVLREIRMMEPERELVIHIGDMPAAHGDPAMIRQLLVNLLSNAVKFTRGKQPARIEVGSLEGRGQAVYYVKDNGVGFDMKYYNKLFGVFQRLVPESQFEGTGVGLAIVQRIIQRHGGRVWAEGKTREGACFYFTFRPMQGMMDAATRSMDEHGKS